MKFLVLFSFLAATVLQQDCDTAPPLNQEILKFVDTKIGRKVGRGECWDLAAQALDQAGATWDHKYKYGVPVGKDECIYPGDLIQFEGVKLQYTSGRAKYTETMSHHTAIVHAVKEKGVYELAHQNTAYSGKKVGLSTLDVKDIVKGKYIIYRPVKE